MTDKNAFSPSVVEAIAGFTAGVISTLCFHPLDLIKTRLQGMAYHILTNAHNYHLRTIIATRRKR